MVFILSTILYKSTLGIKNDIETDNEVRIRQPPGCEESVFVITLVHFLLLLLKNPISSLINIIQFFTVTYQGMNNFRNICLKN